MLSPESLERYRRMSPGERLSLTLRAMKDSTAHLLAGPADVVKRRFLLIRQENDERNRQLRERLGRAEAG
jgi:hypothetical protein